MQSLYHYQSYRHYLNDWFEQKKKTNPNFSFNVWANKLKIKSSSTLIMILNGQRDPGPELTKKLSHYFEFGDEEHEFFEDLVNLEKCEDQQKVLIQQKLAGKSKHKTVKNLSAKEFACISDWHHYAIRECTNLKNYDVTVENLEKTLIDPPDSAELFLSLDRMLELNLIKSENSKIKYSENTSFTNGDESTEALQSFHKQILEKAKDSLINSPPDEREINGLTLSLEKKDLSKAKERITQFLYDFMAEFDSQEGDEVYQLEMALFPLTKRTRNENS